MLRDMSAPKSLATRAKQAKVTAIAVLLGASALTIATAPAAVGHELHSIRKARRHVVNRALEQRGVRYRYGSESPRRGFDCSGLTWWAFDGHGASLVRSSIEQFRMAGSNGYDRVWSRSKLIKGDLVFFKTSRARVGHVGLYIGDGEFVSATSSGVRVDSIFDKYYWGKRYVGATRVPL